MTAQNWKTKEMKKINLMSNVTNEALNSQGLLAWPAPRQDKPKGGGS